MTRLDGYTVADVEAMIDRANVIPTTLASTAQCVFDMDPSRSLTLGYLNNNMRKAATYLATKGIASIVDSTSTYLTHQTNVLGYVSWGSNDANWAPYTTNAIPHNTYVNGAIAETYVSTSGRTFTSPPTYGQSLIADLVAEGVTATKGYVYEPYSTAMADVNILFSRYADGYTVAESYYAASYFLSWMDVIIGDPKYRMVATRLPSDRTIASTAAPNGALPVELTSFTVSGTRTGAMLVWKTATEKNNYGFNIERRTVGGSVWSNVGFVAGHGTSNIENSYSYADANVASGTYAYRISQIDNDGTVKTYNESQVSIGATAKVMSLSNYPNPFNPTTTFEFSVPNDGFTTVKIYNVLGQEVLTAFSGAMKAGELQHATFNGTKFSSGVYFYTIENNGQQMVKKMMMLK